MAEQEASIVASAVIGGITDRALTTVMRKLRSRSRSGAAHDHEKLQRLETLVLKLRCAVEVSEKHAIESASLLEWRDRLRDAATESGAVVLDFQRRAREDGDADADAAATSAPGQQQQQPAAAATTSTGGTYLYFTRSALCGMAQRVREATRRLFTTDEEMKKLDGALEKMERLSPDITQFLLTLQLEVSPQAKRKRVSIPVERMVTSKHDVLPIVSEPPALGLRLRAVDKSAIVQLASAPDLEREEARMLARVLEGPLRRIVSCIKATEDRDMEGLEWLAEWAALLRVAVERGNTVLQTLRTGSDVIHKAGFGALEADGELYCFASAVEYLERLELEEQFFAVLMDLCPTKQ